MEETEVKERQTDTRTDTVQQTGRQKDIDTKEAPHD